jgi:hypothetical protein
MLQPRLSGWLLKHIFAGSPFENLPPTLRKQLDFLLVPNLGAKLQRYVLRNRFSRAAFHPSTPAKKQFSSKHICSSTIAQSQNDEVLSSSSLRASVFI